MLAIRIAADVQAPTMGQAVKAALRVLESYESEFGLVEELEVSLPVRAGMSDGLWRVSMDGQVRPRTIECMTVVVRGMGGLPDIGAMNRRGLESWTDHTSAIRRVA
jgi:hypothetical protein